MTDPELDAAAAEVFAGLLAETHLSRPSDLPALLAEQAAPLGVTDLALYLVDYEQVALLPVPPADRPVLFMEGTAGGRSFSRMAPVHENGRLWLPLLDGTDRLGVVEIAVPPPSGPLLAYLERYVHLAAQLVVGKGHYGDVFELVRRRRPMTVAAELQWRLLPPLVFATHGLVVAGTVEPCYEVGGDTFDYAVNDSTAHLAVFDAMGHGLSAAGTAAVTISAYRNARLARLDLPGTYAAVDATLTGEYGGERFATGLLAQLDLGTGVFRWVSAGHPPPLLMRDGKLVKVLELRPGTPLGVPFGTSPVPVGEEPLEPGDRVLLYTDGVVEARTADGAFFTADRLADFLERESAGDRPTPEILRRLRQSILTHQGGHLQDDATALLVEWQRGTERTLVPATVTP